jgi:diguanylate cyclase (GGDEF)-like protein
MMAIQGLPICRARVHLSDVSSKTPLINAVPGAILLGAAALALLMAPDGPVLAQAARGYPYVALVAALLFAARLERTRLVAAAAVLLVTQLTLLPSILGATPLAQALFVTFLPAGLALLAWRRDAAFTAAGVCREIAFVLAPVSVAAFFSAGNPAGAQQLMARNLVDPLYTDWSRLPQPALLVLLVALVLATVAALRSQRASETGFAWLTLATACALAAQPGSIARSVWLLAAGLVLIVTLVEAAYALAYHDELTGLPGRRALAQAVASLAAPYAIAIVDVDHFKSFNDTHGHDVGDQVLCMVAARLRAVGGGGKAFRSGGEEFTIVFAGLGKREALAHVDAMREAVASATFTLRGDARPQGRKAVEQRGRSRGERQQLSVTVSVGVAAPSARDTSVEAVTRAADQAMYRAKNEGRNRVIA